MCASPSTLVSLPAPSRNSPAERHRPSFSRKLCAMTSAMDGDAVGGRLPASVHRVVAHHAGDAQPVGREDAAAALFLRFPVLLQVAPFRHARLVAPELQRHELARRGYALEPFQRKEAFGLVQFGLELFY